MAVELQAVQALLQLYAMSEASGRVRLRDDLLLPTRRVGDQGHAAAKMTGDMTIELILQPAGPFFSIAGNPSAFLNYKHATAAGWP